MGKYASLEITLTRHGISPNTLTLAKIGGGE